MNECQSNNVTKVYGTTECRITPRNTHTCTTRNLVTLSKAGNTSRLQVRVVVRVHTSWKTVAVDYDLIRRVYVAIQKNTVITSNFTQRDTLANCQKSLTTVTSSAPFQLLRHVTTWKWHHWKEERFLEYLRAFSSHSDHSECRN